MMASAFRIRLFLGLVAGLLLALAPSAVPAQQEGPAGAPADAAAPRVGRYTMVPASGGGFVRLDTETGTVSHCRRETDAADAAWRCAAIPERVLDKPDRIAELEEEVDSLSREVAALRMRLDAEDRGGAAQMSRQPQSDEEFDRALNFSEELMRRFFGMVREMKRSGDGDRS
jgi:hypothetical protein